MTDTDTIDLKETLELIMREGKLSRRQAKRLIMKWLRTGKIKATGVVETDGHMLGRQELPQEFWQVPWNDTEGDGEL